MIERLQLSYSVFIKDKFKCKADLSALKSRLSSEFCKLNLPLPSHFRLVFFHQK